MRQAYRIIPIYTSDVSGVCSALYELGGMVVIHDPSGCNSTYNTHDEIRWYNQDSLIFISGLTEIDAVMGNDEKFLSDIKEAAGELHPKFIALVSSPIPFMNGTDFPALAKVLETETGIPAFAVPTNGMHDYVYGAGKALEEIARRFVSEQMEDRNGSERTVNLLGATPLDFGPISKVEELKKNLEQYGWKTISTWAMGDSLEDLAQAGKAEMNLVISSVGLRAAKMLKEKYGTPYVIGTPYKEYAERISEALEKRIQIPAIEDRRRENLQGTGNSEKIITLIGEPVTIGSLAAIIERRHHYKTRILCPLENAEGLLGEHDLKICGEEEMENALKNAQIVVADPLYRPICPIECEFYERAHIAFSGRMFLKNKYVGMTDQYCHPVFFRYHFSIRLIIAYNSTAMIHRMQILIRSQSSLNTWLE